MRCRNGSHEEWEVLISVEGTYNARVPDLQVADEFTRACCFCSAVFGPSCLPLLVMIQNKNQATFLVILLSLFCYC